jgi:hypothetical protein
MPFTYPVPDPLIDRFALGDLPRYAPWVAEQIDEIGRDNVFRELRTIGRDPAAPQRMTDWVSALSRCTGDMWDVA